MSGLSRHGGLEPDARASAAIVNYYFPGKTIGLQGVAVTSVRSDREYRRQSSVPRSRESPASLDAESLAGSIDLPETSFWYPCEA